MVDVPHPGGADLVPGEPVLHVTVPHHHLPAAEPLLVHLPHSSHPPGAVPGQEGVLHLDQPDVEAGGVERLEEVPGQDVPGPGHEERMDGLEGEDGPGLTGGWERLVRTGGVVLDTAGDDPLLVRELPAQELRQGPGVDVHVVVRLEDEAGLLAVLTRPLDAGNGLESKVLVTVQEVLPHDVPELVTLGLQLLLQARLDRLSGPEEEDQPELSAPGLPDGPPPLPVLEAGGDEDQERDLVIPAHGGPGVGEVVVVVRIPDTNSSTPLYSCYSRDLLEVGVPGGPASPEEDQVEEDQEGEPGQEAPPQPQLGGEKGVKDLGQCLLVTHLMLSTVLTLKVRTGRSQSADCHTSNLPLPSPPRWHRTNTETRYREMVQQEYILASNCFG